MPDAEKPSEDEMQTKVRIEVRRMARRCWMETGLEFPELWEQVQLRAREEAEGKKPSRLPTHFLSGDAWNVLYFDHGRSWQKVVAAVAAKESDG